MLQNLLLPESQDFIQKNINENVAALALKHQKYKHLPFKELLTQIQGKQKALQKLPLWANTERILYPVGISLEQCSSQATATWKATLVGGESCADLTGGFGVDAYFLSKKFENFFYIEQNKELFEVVMHNFEILASQNISCSNESAEFFLNREIIHSKKYTCIYLDPARRDENKQKIFRLEDCQPNILAYLPVIFEKTHQVLLKTSPLLDIHLAIQQLKYVQKIWVVSLENECKEVLYLLENQENNNPKIIAINLTKNQQQEISGTLQEEQDIILEDLDYSFPQKYLYEPNTSILKAGFFKKIGKFFGLAKLHPHTHLYTSDRLSPDFSGRIFEIIAIEPLELKKLSVHLADNKANILIRNFPLSVAEIRKKTRIQEGGAIYLIATKLADNRNMVVIARRI